MIDDPEAVIFECDCGIELLVPGAMVNAEAPIRCPSCLEVIWVLRPEKGGRVLGIGATERAEDCLSYLSVESVRALQTAKDWLATRPDDEDEDDDEDDGPGHLEAELN